MFLALLACNERSDAPRGSVFRYNESKGITSLDPAQARTMGNIWATAQLFDGLVQTGPDMRVQPAIAKRWEILDGGRTYRFTLRDDVHFHDHAVFENGKGRAVTAHDVAFSFKRILDPGTLSPGRWIFNAVDTSRFGGFLAVNDSVVDIFLSESYPPFLGILSMEYCSIVPQEAVQQLGEDFGRRPVGTGPFRFQMWYEGEKLVFHRNPSYFEADSEGNRLPYLDAVGITFTTDAQSVFLEFLKGNLDMLSGLEDGSFRDALITSNGNLQPDMKDRVELLTQPFLNTEYLGFLMDDTAMGLAPEAFRTVRQAVNYGFDRVRMMRYIRNNIGEPGVHGFLPGGLPGVDGNRVDGYQYDPERAAELLEEAGFPAGEGLPEIPLYTTSQYLDLCEYMQSQLQQLGIRLRIEVNPGATHGALVANGQVPFFRKSWIADHADAENFLSLFYAPNRAPKGPNYTHFEHPVYDSLYEASLSVVEDSLRFGLYRSMDSILVAEAPIVVLYYDQVLRFIRPNVKGLSVNAMNGLELKTVKKEP